ncbi:MBL fold metallo-hydrolase [Nocardioides aurantiacus]|uniref:MBL fold metallo-hydrolase n=1 Tax=Nocardioides aurantiacus TaxID=86796 RepID=UPI00403FAA80
MPEGDDRPDLPSTGRGAWAEPGVEQVAPGVHRMPLPLPMDGLRAVNVYVVEGDDGLTLVDGGWAIPESRTVFEDGLRSLGHTPRDVRRFLVTHVHRDHYTQARVLGHELGCPVTLGSGERANLDRLHADAAAGDRRESGTATRLRTAGAAHLHDAWLALAPRRPDALDGYAAPDTWLEHDQDLDVAGRRLRAVSTPGHTRGHYVFADEAASLLFAGDHVLSTITPSIGFEPAYVRQPLRDYLGSLAKVLTLPDLTLLPAHGPVTGSSHARVGELLAHHDVRLAQSLEAVRGGARTAWEVACVLPWTRRERRIEELGPFDQGLAAFETLAHLELLALRADLARRDGEVVEFALPTRG